MRGFLLTLAVLVASAGAATAQQSKITMPDGWVVVVQTTANGSVVTNIDPAGKVESKLRYPEYAGGADRHQALVMRLTPDGARIEKIE